MHVAYDLLVYARLVAFAALLGGALVQVRAREPEVSTAMLHGAWVSLATGVALWALGGTFGVRVAVGPAAVDTALAAVVTLLVVLNRRFFSIPRGLLWLIIVLVLAGAAVVVFW